MIQKIILPATLQGDVSQITSNVMGTLTVLMGQMKRIAIVSGLNREGKGRKGKGIGVQELKGRGDEGGRGVGWIGTEGGWKEGRPKANSP